MAYIGNIPAEAYISISSQTFTTINGTGYTLSSSVESSEDIALFLNNVRQKPSTYTATGTSLTMGTATTTADELYCVYLGKALQTVNPGADSVGTSQIADDAVTTAKIADLNVTVGKLPASVDLSTKTVTLPASVSGLGTGITNAQLAGSIDVTSKITGVVPTANLGSGTASSSTYLAGDQTYKEIVATDIAWQSVVTAATLTAVAGRGYPIDTSSNACTVTLPGSASVGDQIIFTDYARNWNTNAVTINQNSLNFQGSTSTNPVYDTDGESVHIVYMDATKGWIPINDGAVVYETAPAYSGVQFLVVGGGGGGGHGYTGGYYAGGGGAGGYRNSFGSETSGRNSSTESTISFTPGQVYTVTVGTAGAAGASNGLSGSNGGNSSIIGTGVSITSLGGGAGSGGNNSDGTDAASGGCGGGAADGPNYTSQTGGAGTAAQGFDGGDASGNSGGGGGGASADGDDAVTTNEPGGAGLASNITDSSVTRAAGGMGAKTTSGASKTANSGDGGDGTDNDGKTPSDGAAGVVIITIPTANYSGTTTGSPTVTTVGSNKVLVFNGDGSVTG